MLSQLACSYAQRKEHFDAIVKRVSDTYFTSPEKAREDAYQLKKIAKTKLELLTAYKFLGYINSLTGNPDSSRVYFQKRLSICKKYYYNTEEYYQSVIDIANWGKDYLDRTWLVGELTDAISKMDAERFKREKALLSLLLGDVLLKDGETEKARYYYDKSYDYLKNNSPYAAIDYYYRRAEIDVIKEDYGASKKHLLIGLKQFKQTDLFSYAQYLNKLGYTLTMLKEYEEAKKRLRQSLYYQDKYGFHFFTSETYLNLYYLSKAQSDLGLQKKYLDKALETNQGDFFVMRNIHLGYKEYYAQMNDFANERKSHDHFIRLNDSILNIEKAKLRTNLEYRFQQHESEKEIALKEKVIQKDSKIKYLFFIGVALLSVLLVLVLIAYFYKNKVQNKLRLNQKLLHDEQLLLMQENQRKEIIKEKVQTKLEERKKFSMELHDGIANEISALKLSISNENVLEGDEINAILSRIDKLYHEVRNYSHDLDPDNITDVEFSQLVDNLFELIEKKGIVIQRNLLITKNVDSLDESILVNLYRILQEIFNNIIKHAKASEIQVEIYEDENELVMFVKDNGIGISVNSQQKEGIGLKNIKKRVENLKGEYQLSGSSNGTVVSVRIPI